MQNDTQESMRSGQHMALLQAEGVSIGSMIQNYIEHLLVWLCRPIRYVVSILSVSPSVGT